VENFEHIDQIIRQKFENFEPEPPVQVWENVRSSISQSPPPAPSGLMLPILFIATLLMFIGGIVLNLIPGKTARPVTATGPESNITIAGMISTGSTTEPGQTLEQTLYQTYQDNHLEQVMNSTAINAANPAPTAQEIRVKAPFQPINAPVNADRSAKSEKNAPATAATRGHWTPGLTQTIRAGEITVADAVNYNLSPRDVRKLSGYQEYARKSKASWSVGAYFNPEVTVYNSADLANTVSYNISVLPQISFSHFFVQSGINARVTHDKGNSAVFYNKFLGTYQDVYLVSFDSTENGVVPTYFTHEVAVYDTIEHYAVTETQSSFTYLEVPVLFGYQFEFGRFSIFAKGGPAASFLVGKKMPVQDPEEGARIVNVDYQVPSRSTVNWQLMLSAGVGLQLSDRIGFSLEPTFRYSLKSEYDMSGNAGGNACSYGVRAGLNYKF
jgi:hypothetical protein